MPGSGILSPTRGIARGAVALAALLAASHAALAADVASRRPRYDARVTRAPVVVQVMPAAPSEYYERELYQGPPFFYRPYYGSGPALQWFDFGLGRERDTYQ